MSLKRSRYFCVSESTVSRYFFTVKKTARKKSGMAIEQAPKVRAPSSAPMTHSPSQILTTFCPV